MVHAYAYVAAAGKPKLCPLIYVALSFYYDATCLKAAICKPAQQCFQNTLRLLKPKPKLNKHSMIVCTYTHSTGNGCYKKDNISS